MSQNISLWGATYSDVPSVLLPKSGGGTASFTDVTDTTALASDVAQGKYFYLATGEKVQGTATGGGGSVTQDQDGYIVLPPTGGGSTPSGLVYETGTWTPSEDVASYVIPFVNTHTEPPFFYMIADATGTYTDVSSTGCVTFFADWHHFTGVPIYESQSVLKYSEYRTRYKSSSDNLAGGGSALNYPYTDSGSSSASYPGYFISTTGIRAYANSTLRYFRSGRTYKWIAVWAPTT